MSGPGRRIAWCIALSTAGHAAVLLVGHRLETGIGQEGREVQVTMTYHADAAVPASPAVNSTGLTRAGQEQPRETGRSLPARHAVRRHHKKPSHVTAAAGPAPARQTGDTPAPEQAVSAERGSARQSTEEALRKSLMRLVYSRFKYPVLARRKGWQGVVKLDIRIESDGRISRLHVEQTSGYPVLDRAALQALRLASVPDAEHWMRGQAINIIIPVEYRLVGG
jgi:TonB family protein